MKSKKVDSHQLVFKYIGLFYAISNLSLSISRHRQTHFRTRYL